MWARLPNVIIRWPPQMVAVVFVEFGEAVREAWRSVFDRAYPVVASTALYGFTLYWVFYLTSASSWMAYGDGTSSNATRVLAAHKARAATAANTINACILVYAAFLLVGDIGLDVGQVVQIGSVFSIGLSWSMRDSLSSLWASLLLSLTTDIIEGATIRHNGEWYRVLGKRATYVECAWVATRLGKDGSWSKLRDPLMQQTAARQQSELPDGQTICVVGGYISFIPSTSLLQGGYDALIDCPLSSA